MPIPAVRLGSAHAHHQSDAGERPCADNTLALFDAGYLIETLKQARLITGRDIVDPARDGESMVRVARQRREKDQDMAYAADLIASGKPKAQVKR